MGATTTTERLLSKEFIILNLIFLSASTVTAIFFQFHRYLSFIGVRDDWSGFIIAADALPALVIQPVLGVLLSGRNARKWLFIGILGMIFALLMYGLAHTVPALIAVRLLQGAGFACLVAAMMVLTVNYIPPKKSGMAFGIISTVRLIPYAFVPPIMGIYFLAPRDFTKALIYGAIPMIFSLLSAALIRPYYSEACQTDSGHPSKVKDLYENIKNPSVLVVLLLNLLLYSGYTTVFFFFEGYSRTVGSNNPGMFFTVATVAMMTIRIFGSAMFDRFSKPHITFICMSGLIICYAALPFTSFSSIFYALALFTGLGWGIVMPVLNALMFEVSYPRFRGLNLNLSLVMMQGGFFVGPFLGGLVYGWLGYSMLFYFCAFLSLISAVFTLLIIDSTNKSPKDIDMSSKEKTI